jgi:hypothetical protein
MRQNRIKLWPPSLPMIYRVSVGSNERQILRERQAWLRSLDRKYGITR